VLWGVWEGRTQGARFHILQQIFGHIMYITKTGLFGAFEVFVAVSLCLSFIKLKTRGLQLKSQECRALFVIPNTQRRISL